MEKKIKAILKSKTKRSSSFLFFFLLFINFKFILKNVLKKIKENKLSQKIVN